MLGSVSCLRNKCLSFYWGQTLNNNFINFREIQYSGTLIILYICIVKDDLQLLPACAHVYRLKFELNMYAPVADSPAKV